GRLDRRRAVRPVGRLHLGDRRRGGDRLPRAPAGALAAPARADGPGRRSRRQRGLTVRARLPVEPRAHFTLPANEMTLRICSALLAIAAFNLAAAQSYPVKPVRLI